MLIVSFKIHCGGVQSQNDENCVNVQIFFDPTVDGQIGHIHFLMQLCFETQVELHDYRQKTTDKSLSHSTDKKHWH